MPTLTSENETNTDQSPLEIKVGTVGSRLIESLSRVLGDVPGAPYRPQQLAKLLVLNKDLASRLVRALNKRDPMAAIHVMPGPVPLRRVLKSAKKAGVSKELVEEAFEAIEAFDHLIRSEFGARADFDAAISLSDPDARERHELTAKQAAFRGTSGILGISVNVMLVTFLLHPSRDDPHWCDTAVINSYFGLRRIRPGANFEFTTFQEGRKQQTHDQNNEGRKQMGGHRSSPFISQFCSPSQLPFEIIPEGNKLRYVMVGAGVGQRSAVDIVTHELYLKNHPVSVEQSDSQSRWFYATTDQPASLMVFDMFVHKDVWAGCTPSLVQYDTVIKGVANPDDHTRDQDRLDLHETVLPLGDSPGRFRNPDVPRYTEMLNHTCESYDWKLKNFRGYRTRISYPFHGSQVCMVFKQQ